MKIVFLDRDTLDAGDIDFTALEKLGEVVYYGLTAPAQVSERIAGAEIVLTNKVVLDRSAIEGTGSLRAIQVVATGTNNVDLQAAKDRGIAVMNVKGYSTPGVAQHVFAMLLNLVTKVDRYTVAPASWAESPMFTRLDHPIHELQGLTFGIAGYGDIGQAVARIGESFGMTIVALAREGSSDGGEVERWQADRFFSECDVISLHCPLTEHNHHMINQARLEQMKPTAILINTGRGDLVNEADLLTALQAGEIGGAGLDVLSQEPPAADHPLITADLPNLLITPHTAWSSVQSRLRLLADVVVNLEAFQAGTERNRVA